MTQNCFNCQNPTSGKYCDNCGAATFQERIGFDYAKAELLQLAGYEKGFLFTFKKLLISPGKTLEAYLCGSRSAIVKPVTFLFVASVIYTLISNYFGLDAMYESQYKSAAGSSSVVAVMQWVQQNYGYSNVAMLLLIAPWVKVLFRKSGLNFYEILVLLCFVMGQAMLLLSLQPVLFYFLGDGILSGAIMPIAVAYVVWALGQFFGRKFTDYIKAFAAYGLGFLAFNLLAALIAIGMELTKF